MVQRVMTLVRRRSEAMEEIGKTGVTSYDDMIYMAFGIVIEKGHWTPFHGVTGVRMQ